MIGIMISDISNPFYYTIIHTIQDAEFEQNFDVFIANTDCLHRGQSSPSKWDSNFIVAIGGH
jgi:DNA-binding LacI/PurR family transcriptional regulator